MNVQHTPTAIAESRERHRYARVPEHWLPLARGFWITLVVFTLAIFFASLPGYVAQLHTPCAGSACGFQQLTLEKVSGCTVWLTSGVPSNLRIKRLISRLSHDDFPLMCYAPVEV